MTELPFINTHYAPGHDLGGLHADIHMVSLGAHWVDSRESSLLRRLERGREIGL